MRGALLAGLVGCSFAPGAARTIEDAPASDTLAIDTPMVTADVPADTPLTTKRRIKLTFRNASRSSNLDGFAALVKLDATRIDYASVVAQGADLRFFDSDDATALPYEIEHWDPSGTSIVWVRVPRIDASSDTDFIYLHYGDPLATTDAQDPPMVWTSAVGVWHLADDPGPGLVGDIKDSSAGGRDGTASSTLTSANRVPAAIGDGLQLPGNVTGVTASAATLSTYTYQLWVRGDAAPVTGSGNKQPLSDGNTNFNFAWDHNLAAFTGATAHHDAGAATWRSVSYASFQGATWYLVTATYDGANLCMFVDGAAPACTASGAPDGPGGAFLIGPETSTAASFAGILDEVRVLSVARSADWINAEYASQRADDATPFVVFGTAEPVP